MTHQTASPPVRRLTRPPHHHFFGYYDKSPWDPSGRYVLGMRADFRDRPPTAEDAATIGMIDTQRDDRWEAVAQTRSWNWQQGCMLQWLPGAEEHLIVYNARQGDRAVGVVMDAFSGEERVLPRPVYDVSPTGRVAASVSFARIADTRPGYGYYGLEDPFREQEAPEADGIHLMDLQSGEFRLAVSLARVAAIRHQQGMDGAKHWINHVQFAPDGSRFAFLHRWREGGDHWRTRLFTADPDGADLRCLADDGVVSHYDWRDPDHVLAWARQEGRGDRFFLFTDGAGQAEIVGEGILEGDGHCSWSPDRRWILTDTYPGDENMRTLILYRPDERRRIDVGRFHSPPELSGEVRCDLHPRWSRDGRSVCFDSAHECSRQMYVADVSQIVGGD
ncbi:MAG: hypothetical protein ACOC7T_06135 [Planctomycetota bacterium]